MANVKRNEADGIFRDMLSSNPSQVGFCRIDLALIYLGDIP